MNATKDTKRKRILQVLLFVAFSAFCVLFMRTPFSPQEPRKIDEKNLKSFATPLSLVESEYEAMKLPIEKNLSKFGRELFFDQRLSKNSAVSCASCHIPELYFTDAQPVSTGLGLVSKNAPSIVNSRFQSWFFWNGRADSLASQVLGPFTHPHEQGLSFTGIARRIREHYLTSYETFFGPWPQELRLDILEEDALPPTATPQVSPEVAAYALATVDYDLLKNLLSIAQDQKKKPVEVVLEYLQAPAKDIPAEWSQRFLDLPEETQRSLYRVVANVGMALAAYERNLIAIESPFDQFVRAYQRKDHAHDAFNDGFGKKEYAGLKVFLKSNCDLCHSGARLSDDQFHNIGLSQTKHLKFPDLGRSEGVLLALADQFNCEGEYLKIPSGIEPSEACKELGYLNTEGIELVGAFKTPSLRNVAKTAPYFHDGRAASLDEVLDHYQNLKDRPAVGHREESLQPMRWSATEREELKAFLMSLTSPISDLSL